MSWANPLLVSTGVRDTLAGRARAVSSGRRSHKRFVRARAVWTRQRGTLMDAWRIHGEACLSVSRQSTARDSASGNCNTSEEAVIQRKELPFVCFQKTGKEGSGSAETLPEQEGIRETRGARVARGASGNIRATRAVSNVIQAKNNGTNTRT